MVDTGKSLVDDEFIQLWKMNENDEWKWWLKMDEQWEYHGISMVNHD